MADPDPSTPPPPGPYRALPSPGEEQIIRALSAAAARNHRSLPPHHPARRASRELSSLLRELLQRGVPAGALALLLTPPVTHQAVRARAAAAPPPPAPPAPLPAPAPERRPDAPWGTTLITSAPYRRVRLTAPPYPFPPAPLPVFSPPTAAVSEQFLRWLASPQRAPGAAYADNSLIRLHLVPVAPGDDNSNNEEGPR